MNKLSLLLPMGDGREPEASAWDTRSAVLYEQSLFASSSGTTTTVTEPDLVLDDSDNEGNEEIDLDALEASELNSLVHGVQVVVNSNNNNSNLDPVFSRTSEHEVASLVSSLTTVSVCGTATLKREDKNPGGGYNEKNDDDGEEEDWEMLSTASSVVSFDAYSNIPGPHLLPPNAYNAYLEDWIAPHGLGNGKPPLPSRGTKESEANSILCEKELKVPIWKKIA